MDNTITTKQQNNHHHHEDDKKKKMKKKSSTQKGVRLSTDPQSVAARERRHRISERFKVLQSLVPGGTKMDTVSMLEEAIHYVKFLQTQIWLHQNCSTNTVNSNNITTSCFNLQDHDQHDRYNHQQDVHPSLFCLDNVVNTIGSSSSSPSTLNLHYPSSSSYSTSPNTQYDNQQQQQQLLLSYSSTSPTTSTYFTTGMQCPPASSSLAGYLEGHPAATLPPAAYCCDHEDDDDQYQALLSLVSSSTINY